MTLPWSMPLPLSAPISGPPQWIEPIADEEISNATSYDLTWTGDYELVVIDVLKLVLVTDNQNLLLRTSSDGGATWDAGASDYQAQVMGVSAGNLQRFNNSMATDQIWTNPTALQHDSLSYGGATLQIIVLRPFAAEYTQVQGHGGYYGNSGPGSSVTIFSGARKEAGRVDGIRLFSGGSNISTGRVRARGIVGLR